MTSWTLAEGSTPVVWWTRRDDCSILSDRDRGVQVRWKEAVREELNREPPALAVPAGFDEDRLRRCDLSEPAGRRPSS